MPYLIVLGVESLAVALLLVAVFVAASSSAHRLVRVGVLLLIVVIGLLYTGWILLISYTWFADWAGKSGVRWLLAASCLAVPYVLGVVLLLQGWRLRKGEKPLLPRAAAWSRVGLLTLFLAALMLELLTLMMFDLTIRQTLAAVRVEAYTLAASVAPQRPPAEQNAALLYDPLFRNWHATKKGWPKVFDQALEAMTKEAEGKTPSELGPQNAETEPFDFASPELGEFLRKRAGELALLRRAAALPECRFERDYFRPRISMPLNQLSDLRLAAHLLEVDARHSSVSGNIRQAIDDINAIFGLARHAREPFLVAILVSISLETKAVRELENVLSRGDIHEDLLSRIQLDRTSSLQEAFLRSVRMEEALGLLTFCSVGTGELALRQLMDGGGQPGPLGVLHSFGLPGFPWLLDDLTVFRQFMRDIEPLVTTENLSLTDQLRLVESLEQKLRNVRWRAPLTHSIYPAYRNVLIAMARAEGYRRAAVTGVAVYRYALRHNKLPESLEELVPEDLPFVPTDPIDGHPMRVRSLGEGELIVYSIGQDLTDDGGQPLKMDPRVGLKGDVRFVVRWRAPNNQTAPPR